MSEAKIEQKACDKILEIHGIRNIKLNIKGNTGYPDRQFFIPGGKPLFIEFKAPGEKPTNKQVYIIKLLMKAGYNVCICDSVEGALVIVDKILRGKDVRPGYGIKMDTTQIPRRRNQVPTPTRLWRPVS